MAPSEWDSPYPCIQDPEELENCFTLLNSLWFIIATFLCQGADIAPRYKINQLISPIQMDKITTQPVCVTNSLLCA